VNVENWAEIRRLLWAEGMDQGDRPGDGRGGGTRSGRPSLVMARRGMSGHAGAVALASSGKAEPSRLATLAAIQPATLESLGARLDIARAEISACDPTTPFSTSNSPASWVSTTAIEASSGNQTIHWLRRGACTAMKLRLCTLEPRRASRPSYRPEQRRANRRLRGLTDVRIDTGLAPPPAPGRSSVTGRPLTSSRARFRPSRQASHRQPLLRRTVVRATRVPRRCFVSSVPVAALR